METYSEQIVNLGTVKKQPSQASLFVWLLIILLLITVSGFGGGYLFGQIRSSAGSNTVLEKSTTTENKDGNKVFSDTANGYQIIFSKDFELEENKDTPGLKLTKDKSTLELWLGVDQPVDFSEEQEAAIKTKNFSELAIENQKAKMTEYIYQAGNIFSDVKLGESDDRPQVIFWLKGENSASYEALKKIAQTFKFI